MNYKLFLAIIFFLLSPICFSQTINFSYDASGNRVKREIIMNRYDTKQKKNIYFSEFLAKQQIKIYPNPTEGVIKIEISGLKKDDTGVAYIHNLKGIEICSSNTIFSPIQFDITSQTKGIYILTIRINESTTTWKIIK